MGVHQVDLGPNTYACLDVVARHWRGSPRNEIISSGLAFMSRVYDFRRSGRELVAGVERRGRPSGVLRCFPWRHPDYDRDECAHRVAGVLDLGLRADAERHLQELCINRGPDGVSRPRAVADVVREAIWSARWLKDIFQYNQQTPDMRDHYLFWVDCRPRDTTRSRDRWYRVLPQDVWRAPNVIRPSTTPTPPVAPREHPRPHPDMGYFYPFDRKI